MRYGREPEPGFLPVFSVGSEAEAHRLLVYACSTNLAGDFIARELVEEQTLDNLFAFGDRLAELHARTLAGTAHCDCQEEHG